MVIYNKTNYKKIKNISINRRLSGTELGNRLSDLNSVDK